MKYECPACGEQTEAHAYYKSKSCENDECRVNSFQTDREDVAQEVGQR